MSAPILEVSALSKKFCRDPHFGLRYFLQDVGREIRWRSPLPQLRAQEFWALRDVSFSMQSGEVLGVIGHNGAGKSTLINLLAGVMRPTTGRVTLHTKRVALVEHGGGLDPSLTGRENARNRLVLHGCHGKSLPEKERGVIEFAEIGSFIDAPVGTYSLGMRQRLAFSIYTQLEPELFIIDEALSGGDLRFSRKFSAFLKTYVKNGGSILLCSHSLPSIQWLCPRSILLDGGKLLAEGPTTDVIDAYQKLCEDRDKRKQVGSKNAHASHARESSPEEVRILNVSATGADGGAIVPRCGVQIRVTFDSPRPMGNLCCSIEIGNAAVFPISVLHGGLEDDLQLCAGSSTMTFRIPSLPLTAGTYRAQVLLVEKDNAVPVARYGFDGPACEFVVTKEPDLMSNMAAYRNYLLNIEHEWSIESGNAPAELTPGTQQPL
ncbi:MAG: ABC transporter ATP-binding protein [Chthoniobacterales bacterium]|nr:ABC transporter ATP-binding protein [Chthoniobacterales bacterium]